MAVPDCSGESADGAEHRRQIVVIGVAVADEQHAQRPRAVGRRFARAFGRAAMRDRQHQRQQQCKPRGERSRPRFHASSIDCVDIALPARRAGSAQRKNRDAQDLTQLKTAIGSIGYLSARLIAVPGPSTSDCGRRIVGVPEYDPLPAHGAAQPESEPITPWAAEPVRARRLACRLHSRRLYESRCRRHRSRAR